MEDTIVCGGGPAGLAAATWLGRYRRRAILFDAGGQRNLAASASHGYLTRDNISPREFLEAARLDLSRYDTVRQIEEVAKGVERTNEGFSVTTEGGSYRARTLMICTGVEDAFPDIVRFHDFYGTAVFHCSCCDGLEAEGRDVLAIGWGAHASGYAIELLEWASSVTLVTDGREFEGKRQQRELLGRYGIDVVEDTVLELQGKDGHMTGARLASGDVLTASMAFFSIGHDPRNNLAKDLGCDLDDDGYIVVDQHGETSVKRVYAAGDVVPGEQLVQMAAAQGAVAGIACAMSLSAHHLEHSLE